jgi:pyruvate dehydrogenase E2 component (dihydrolipoamide acetyltransferase)
MTVEITMPRLSDTMAQGTILNWRVKPGDRVVQGAILAEVETDQAILEMEAAQSGVVAWLAVAEGETVAVGAAIAVLEPEAEGGVVAQPLPAAAGAAGGKKSVKVRRLLARKMTEAWQSIPHFFVTVAVDMTDIIRFRKDLGVSINDFILEATARSLKEHPWVNSYWGDGEGVEQPRINLAMAVATEGGLYNPVIQDCGALSLKEISQRAAELADRAHRGKLTAQDTEGGTFTISNMGMLGVESFSAIITPPQAAVLAVGTIKGEVVVDDKGEPGIAPILRLTLSADHRILDGADAADFLTTLKSYLEAPVTLLSCS